MRAAGRPRLAVPVPEMLDQALRPPARLGCHIADAAAPPRRRDSAARRVVEQHLALVEVEVGQRAQQQRLAGAREPAQRARSEERHGGKGWVSTVRSRWARDHEKKKKKTQ